MKIDFDLIGIGSYLKDNKLKVPTYQRSYAWEERQINDLFQDISASISSKAEEYFLGTIVIKSNDHGRSEVIDGQQRLASIMIALSVLRSFSEQLKEDKLVRLINRILKSEDYDDSDEPNLLLNENDKDFFSKIIIESIEIVPIRDSHRKIKKASSLLNSKFHEILVSPNEKREVIKKWIKYLEQNVKVIVVEVPDYANAFSIFETLNDRGLKLATSDLLKNYLFSKANKDQLDEIKNNWVSMYGIFEAASEEDEIVTYIRYLWASMFESIREKELYSKIKDKINSQSKAVDFSQELKKTATNYIALSYAEHQIWKEYADSVRKDLKIINDLGLKQIRPLLLSIIERFSPKELTKAFGKIVSMIVRINIAGNFSSGAIEEKISKTAVKIRNENIVDTKIMLGDLKSLIPSDDQFYESFLIGSVSKEIIARYYLYAIEKTLRKEKGISQELSPADSLTLEHILPKNLDVYENFTEEEHKNYFRRIGNLTLLLPGDNVLAGNKPFQDKIQIYKNSSLLINQLSDLKNSWNQDSIKKRQKELAKVALKTWKL